MISSRLSSEWMAVMATCLAMAAGTNRAMAQRPLGIDVSSYQGGSINWTKVQNAGVTFAWAKAAEGLTIADADFTVNEAHAKAAGVLIGAYYYAHPEIEMGTSGADQAAAYFWSLAKSYITTNGDAYLMPMLDFEQNVNSANPAYTAATLSGWVNEWCQDLVNYGKSNGVIVTPVVYTYISYADGGSGYGPGLNSTVTQWPLWMANTQYSDPQTGAPHGTSPWSNWTLWQYCTTNLVSGVSGAVDQDVFDGTLAQLTNSLVIRKSVVPVVINGVEMLANGAVQMSFTGTPGYTYFIQATASLNPPAIWTILSTNVADTNGQFTFTDQGAPNYNGRFYRTTTQ